MFRGGQARVWQLRRLYSHTTNGSYRLKSKHIACSAAATAILWYLSSSIVHNDATAAERVNKAREQLFIGFDSGSGISTVVWGSNKNNTIAPHSPDKSSVRSLSIAPWLQNVALRDLALHETHAACIDARGNLYQWGDGFFGNGSSWNGKPSLTLRGKNITGIQLTDTRVYALSKSGRIYVLSAESSRQSSKLQRAFLPAISTWYRPGWLLGQDELVDFVEILPKEHLSRGEKFISISAGSDHLLALTSSGRAFAHPITKKANSHGQLGFRKFDLPTNSSDASLITTPSRVAVELHPKAMSDPYTRVSSQTRPNSSSKPDSEVLPLLDDTNIRFSDTLFEIPSLKGLDIAQVVAGGRSSFAKTESGRVLAWGANESGQLGLGGNVTLDTISVPTEVILWRNVSNKVQSKCLDIYAGNDLTCFIVERKDERDFKTVDTLMCGNGRYGGIGNNLYSSAQGSPMRVKGISGFLEYSETEQSLCSIVPYSVSVSPTGHVLVTLDTHKRSGHGAGGRDIFVWGTGQDYELGNGKRSSLATPTTLTQADGTRRMLMKIKADVKDLQGKVWKRQVEVEQCAVGGYGNTVVYWKIC